MDITQILRYVRFFFAPFLTFLFGLVFIAISPRSLSAGDRSLAWPDSLGTTVLMLGASVAMAGVIWFAYNGYRLARWGAGLRDEDCN